MKKEDRDRIHPDILARLVKRWKKSSPGLVGRMVMKFQVMLWKEKHADRKNEGKD
jgi:hypothetical protein